MFLLFLAPYWNKPDEQAIFKLTGLNTVIGVNRQTIELILAFEVLLPMFDI